MEQQAIGRVYRPGQTRNVRVHRLVLHGPKGEPTVDQTLVERNTEESTIMAATSD